MSQEEWDGRADAGEDPYSISADDLQRQGYVWDGTRYVSPVEQENRALKLLLAEAVEWSRRPSPIPIVPFQEFIDLTLAARGEGKATNGAVRRWREFVKARALVGDDTA